jgi:ethanolamine utilization protein EutA (predicted chaperonin)
LLWAEIAGKFDRHKELRLSNSVQILKHIPGDGIIAFAAPDILSHIPDHGGGFKLTSPVNGTVQFHRIDLGFGRSSYPVMDQDVITLLFHPDVLHRLGRGTQI